MAQDYLRHIQKASSSTREVDYGLTNNIDERYADTFPSLDPNFISQLCCHHPPADYSELKSLIRQKFKVNRVVLGSGGEELIVRINRIIADSNRKIGIALPIFYRILETLPKVKYKRVNPANLKSSFPKVDAFWIANPNPLTGEVLNKKVLITVIKKYPETLFMIDEAAMLLLPNWANYSLMESTTVFHNLLVLSSFGKLYGLTGLRAGFASGNDEFLSKLEKSGATFPLTSFTAYVLQKLLNKDEVFDHIRTKIYQNKKEAENMLRTKPHLEVLPSVLNCIFCRYKNGTRLYDRLIKLGIMGLDLDTQTGINKKGVVRLTTHSSKKLHQVLMNALGRV